MSDYTREDDAKVAEALGYQLWKLNIPEVDGYIFEAWDSEMIFPHYYEKAKSADIDIDNDIVEHLATYLTNPTPDSEWEVWRWMQKQDSVRHEDALRKLLGTNINESVVDLFWDYELGAFARALLEVIR